MGQRTNNFEKLPSPKDCRLTVMRGKMGGEAALTLESRVRWRVAARVLRPWAGCSRENSMAACRRSLADSLLARSCTPPPCREWERIRGSVCPYRLVTPCP